MGRGKRKEISSEMVDEFVNKTMSSDVMSMEDVEKYPELADMLPRDQIILMASAAGVSQAFIADAVGTDQPHVSRIIKRIDPNNIYKLSPSSKKAFMTKLYETRGSEALLSITPEKLKACSASELARVAKTCSDAAQNLNQTKHRNSGESRLDLLMDAIESETVSVVDGDFEVSG